MQGLNILDLGEDLKRGSSKPQMDLVVWKCGTINAHQYIENEDYAGHRN